MNIKKFWTAVISIAGGLAIIGGIFTFSDRFVTRDILATELKVVDQKVAQSIDNINKSMQYQFNANRYATLTDQAAQLKLLLRKNPNDEELKAELKRVLEDREKARIELQVK